MRVGKCGIQQSGNKDVSVVSFLAILQFPPFLYMRYTFYHQKVLKFRRDSSSYCYYSLLYSSSSNCCQISLRVLSLELLYWHKKVLAIGSIAYIFFNMQFFLTLLLSNDIYFLGEQKPFHVFQSCFRAKKNVDKVFFFLFLGGHN